MTREKAKQCVKDAVEGWQGLKSTELVSKIAEWDKEVFDHDVVVLTQELVDEGELMEVEYVVPNLPFRAKSFLLPKGSEIQIIDNRKK